MSRDMDPNRLGNIQRLDMWSAILRDTNVRSMAEIGVWAGRFAAEILEHCPSIETYYMIDPWRNLDDWNKPWNMPDPEMDKVMAKAVDRTRFAADRVKILRGRTVEVVDQIPDASLDFAYLDGDHTLRGITIDLHRILPKIRPGGCIGGDDFYPRIGGHAKKYEPTFVFPYAVYFAEAVGARISALKHNQFLIQLGCEEGPLFSDLTGRYRSTSVSWALYEAPRPYASQGLARRLLRRAGLPARR